MASGASGIFEVAAHGTRTAGQERSGRIHLEVQPVSNVNRKHPVSIAVSMALLAAAAAAAVASESKGAPAEDAAAESPAQQDVPTAPSPDHKKVKSGTGGAASESEVLETVTVIGVRQSQIKSIEAKRSAPSIQDSISAESIGQLPDVTITDALQRITGVQINRDAGVGTSVAVRGLPQVGTMLNGEVFITPDQIDSQQPDF